MQGGGEKTARGVLRVRAPRAPSPGEGSPPPASSLSPSAAPERSPSSTGSSSRTVI